MTYFKNISLIILCLFLTYIAYRYRIRQYDQIPRVYSTFDEQAYLWAGESLLSTGIPTGWSIMDIYFNKSYQLPGKPGLKVEGHNITVEHQLPNLTNWSKFPKPIVIDQEVDIDGYRSNFRIIQPFQENPPLAGIPLALINQSTNLLQTSVKQIRLIPIILTSLTTATVFLLSYSHISFWPSLISALIYALGPGFIISGRLALPENMLTFLLPLSLLLLTRLRQFDNSKLQITHSLLLIISFISPLLKLSGLIIPTSLALILIYKKNYKPAIHIIIAATLGILAYLIYGFYYESQMFWQILQEQSQRKYLGPISMFIKIFYPQIPLPFFDGWIVLGWLSAFWLILSPSALRRKKQGEVLSKTTDFQTTKLSYISIPITIHLFFFTLYGGDNFPWYMFIPYPLLALSTGIIIHRYIIKPNIYYNLIFYLIPFSSYWHYSHWTEKIDWRTILSQYRLSFIIFIIIPFFVYILKEKYTKLGQLHNSTIQISLHIMIFITLYLSIKTTNNMITIWLLLENLPYPLIWNR